MEDHVERGEASPACHQGHLLRGLSQSVYLLAVWDKQTEGTSLQQSQNIQSVHDHEAVEILEPRSTTGFVCSNLECENKYL